MPTAMPSEESKIAVNIWPERVEMMQWWSDYIDMLRDGATVLPFHRSA